MTGFVEQEVVVNAGRTSSIEIKVRPRAAIFGFVENVTTAAWLKGVRVKLADAEGNALGETATGEDGSFRFDGLSKGTYHISCVLPKGYVADGEAVQWVEVATGRDSRCDFRVYRHGRVDGRVVTHDGEPVTQAEVVLVDSTGTVVRTGRTDPDGSYSFPDVPVDKYRVRVSLPAR